MAEMAECAAEATEGMVVAKLMVLGLILLPVVIKLVRRRSKSKEWSRWRIYGQ